MSPLRLIYHFCEPQQNLQINVLSTQHSREEELKNCHPTNTKLIFKNHKFCNHLVVACRKTWKFPNSEISVIAVAVLVESRNVLFPFRCLSSPQRAPRHFPNGIFMTKGDKSLRFMTLISVCMARVENHWTHKNLEIVKGALLRWRSSGIFPRSLTN